MQISVTVGKETVCFSNKDTMIASMRSLASFKQLFPSCTVSVHPEVLIHDFQGTLFEMALRYSLNGLLEDVLRANPAFLSQAFGEHMVPALVIATRYENSDACKILINCGANPDAQDRHGNTALHWAVYGNLDGIASLLIAHGANIDVQDKHGNTALHWAVVEKREATILLLIKNNANCDIQDKHGYTALQCAINKGCYNEFKVFLDQLYLSRVSRISAVMDRYINKMLDTLLQLKSWEDGHERILMRLLENYSVLCLSQEKNVPGILQKSSTQLKTYLLLVVLQNSSLFSDARLYEICSILLQDGADQNGVDAGGNTPLHYASAFGCHGVIELLAHYKAEYLLNQEGETPLCQAIIRGQYEGFVSTIGFFNVAAREVDGFSRTPLHHLSQVDSWSEQHTKMLHFWVQRRRDQNQAIYDGVKDGDGNTALALAYDAKKTMMIDLAEDEEIFFEDAIKWHLAACCDNARLQALLKAYLPVGSGQIDSQDSTGLTPLLAAVCADKLDNAETLICHGANKMAQDRWGRTCLILCLEYNQRINAYWQLRRLLGSYFKRMVNKVDGSGCKPLHYAAKHGRSDIMHDLIASGASPNARDSNSNTALHYAACYGHLQCVIDLCQHDKILLNTMSKGLPVGGDIVTGTPLYIALSQENCRISEVLFLRGASIVKRGKNQGCVLFNLVTNKDPSVPYDKILTSLVSLIIDVILLKRKFRKKGRHPEDKILELIYRSPGSGPVNGFIRHMRSCSSVSRFGLYESADISEHLVNFVEGDSSFGKRALSVEDGDVVHEFKCVMHGISVCVSEFSERKESREWFARLIALIWQLEMFLTKGNSYHDGLMKRFERDSENVKTKAYILTRHHTAELMATISKFNYFYLQRKLYYALRFCSSRDKYGVTRSSSAGFKKVAHASSDNNTLRALRAFFVRYPGLVRMVGFMISRYVNLTAGCSYHSLAGHLVVEGTKKSTEADAVSVSGLTH